MRRHDKRDRNARPLLLLALSLVAVMALSACTSSSQAETSAALNTSSESLEATAESSPVADMTVGDPVTVDPATREGATEAEDSADANDVSREAASPDETRPLPRLLDLGATSCIPCKLMAPILEELAETKKEYLEVLFIDVWENRDKGREYGVSAIPTQIFFAANGEELYSHIGFYSREQILGKWRDLGIEVGE